MLRTLRDDRPALLAEFVGTAFLLIAVIGSGIMAEQLSDDVGLVLFQNAFATAGALLALILAFSGASGAHFNPAVTLVALGLGDLPPHRAGAYVVAQVSGGIAGAAIANVMFDLPVVEWSTTDRSDARLVFAEVVATIGLLLMIQGVVRNRSSDAAATRTTNVALAVAGYIGGAYYFTSSTSFANPAVTIGRTLSDTFAGIDPASAPGFIGAQLVGAGLALLLVRAIWPSS